MPISLRISSSVKAVEPIFAICLGLSAAKLKPGSIIRATANSDSDLGLFMGVLLLGLVCINVAVKRHFCKVPFSKITFMATISTADHVARQALLAKAASRVLAG